MRKLLIMKKFKIIFLLTILCILGQNNLLGQNTILNANLLETNFSADSHPANINFINTNKVIFNAKFGITVKNSDNENSKLLIKISSEYKNYVNEDNTYTYDATKAIYISVYDNIAYFFIKKNSKLSLWKTDGTNTGTSLIKEFANPNFATSDFVITSFSKFNTKLFFNIYHMFGSPSRSELWVSDQTPSGTEIIQTLNNNSTFTAGNYIQNANSLYFTNYNSNSEKKIWKSTGSVASTVPLFTGVQDDFSVGGNMINYNGYLYFIKIKNNSLYLSYYDPNTNVIIDVKNLPGALNNDSNIYLQNNFLVFFSNNSLWKSDGTLAGTNIINSSSYPNYGNLGINNITVFKNKIYFDCYLGSYSNFAKLIYDGTSFTKFSDVFPELSTATFIKKSIPYTGENKYLIFGKYINSNYQYFVFDGVSSKQIQNLLFDYSSGFEMDVKDTPDTNFLINAGNKKYGQEIFKFNFINASSSLYENANSTSGSYMYGAQKINGKLFYFGTDENGLGPIMSDGTPNGTVKIKNEITAPFFNSNTANIGEYVPNVKVNNKIYFPCSISGSTTSLCVSDGTAAGTLLVKNINPAGKDGSNSYDFPSIIKLGQNTNKFLFKVDESNFAAKLWVSDGTEAGTFNLNSLPHIRELYALLNNKTYYVAVDYNLNRAVLMVTDGTQAGTQLFYDFSGTRKLNSILGYTNNKFFILVDNAIDYWTTKKELWVSDGTVAGTTMIKSFSHPHYSNPGFNNNATVNNDKLYFFACAENSSNMTLHSPYVSDGTVTGTMKLSTDEFSNGAYPTHMFGESFVSVCEGKTYFINKPNYNAYSSLWVYSNNQMSNIFTNSSVDVSLFAPNNLICINNNLFFLNRKYTENKVWVTNGTQIGTKEFDINANNNIANNIIINSMSELNNKLFINAPFKDSNSFNYFGNELYVLDVSNVLNTKEVIGQTKSDLAILAFPNPTTSVINLKSTVNNSIKSIKLFTMTGSLILSKENINSPQFSLSLNNAIQGIYILKIFTEKGIVVKKIIKK